ncbi:MAG: RNA polymerase sigma factor [Candidatus Acidiferrales bacterium]
MKAAEPKARPASSSDAELVKRCAGGDEDAWGELIDKYKNLIFSIPIKYGFSRDDAAEVFQQVCFELLTRIRHLRNPTALPKWLIQVTAHRCFHWRKQSHRFVASSGHEAESTAHDGAELPLSLLQEAEREQALRDALARLTPRCQELMQMLFFEAAPRPYSEVAASLGIATGSIGFIRGRCLEKLRAQLEESGFA